MTWLVFTDLDGTLLDHATYDWSPARPALDRLAALGIPLILASSKTAAEIAPLHGALGLGQAPAIVENGAGIWQPGDAEAAEAPAYRRLRWLLEEVPPPLRARFCGFGDMDDRQVAALTGLSPAAAALARRRKFSEPGLWQGTAEERRAFLGELERLGLAARDGGRFLTLSFGATKAGRMAEIALRYGAGTTVALGDAPNDREMIEAATHGVIIRNPHGPGLPELSGEAAGRIRRSAAEGPEGWNAAILDLTAGLAPQES
ncbi:HAD-IIB family hydrolase [Mangrovicoccus algicola]|uniref:HAD-IIB family hydrolase n=1 Tax=Mangrovicoccus algicola TaxID=2771008 RepID=A0A8J6Z7T2_9RHOB|nr:HAD-IIB family hydrolase [Mangrovicoccus algicola]MBE3637391.1 HAD-IIB family hydrolase [Mangrovicoccus algicola]